MRLVNLCLLGVWGLPSKRFGWIKKEAAVGKTFRDKLMRLNRYLPFTRVQADIIYFPWNSAAIGYQGLYALGIPVVVSCRGSQVNIKPHKPGNESYVEGLRATLEGAAAVHCVSHAILEEARPSGLDDAKARVIRPAVDPKFFNPAEGHESHERFRIITTGSLIWTKGYETALLALRELCSRGVDTEFHIIGDGPERQRILYTIQDLGLEGRVVLHGKLPPEQVRDRLQGADVFLLSSLSEGISNAVLEAKSCGLPVVTTDCGGMREAVSDGVEGFVVPVRAPKAMADALYRLARDPELRARIGQAGRQRVEQEFDQHNQIGEWIKLFLSVKGMAE
jgi:glycosyltransferase involved in cell wall biosynthesis